MAEEPSRTTFREAGIAPIGMAGAIARARDELRALTQYPVDSITRTERNPDGGWTIVIDIVESVARMGDNDLLNTYELEMDTSGEVIRLERIARYRREQGS